ncbi:MULTISPECIES: zinc-dependent alcohol dehydrogenase family protein [Bradyrhizobium]|uniref:NADPH:quinone reductase n=2 Tax=Bradyrhizobium TaxID=374 RepID=A0ABY0PDU5_9BRAD|nr:MULTISPECIES: zinc-dependent alcohol dehydrogenase family protein [Bradyrhizobium]SDI17679.1 NADPH:quinone reductase [Bradyrhizobium ottawaense]SED76435.1 NADPH:quinone reductase [Bradyrhizobium lablabi]
MSRSVRFHEFGGPEVLKIEDVVVPDPSPKEVRLRIKAIGLNRSEVLTRSGRAATKATLPAQLGLEAAGAIEALGSDVDGLAVGDRVAVIPGEIARGYYGEVALAPARTLVKIPHNQSWQDAAATWMAFATAWTGLIDIARLSAGRTVLITAASSSTGLAAIQIARKVGATPVALTRTSAKAAALFEAGAAQIIATEEQDLVAEVARLTVGKGANVVFDAVGGPTFEKLTEATAIGGLLIVYGRLSPEATPLPLAQVLWKDLTVRGFGLPTTVARDEKLAAPKKFIGEGFASGELRPIIAKPFPLDEIVAAHRYIEAGAQFGKVVVTV